jgi:hypothetical protein
VRQKSYKWYILFILLEKWSAYEQECVSRKTSCQNRQGSRQAGRQSRCEAGREGRRQAGSA